MEKILKQVHEFASVYAKRLEMEIIAVEYVHEDGMNILRVTARKAGMMTVDDCSDLSSLISDELDRLDLIAEEYYLEVTSEGIERELRTNSEINAAISEYICIETNSKNEIYGYLRAATDDEIMIEVNMKGRKKTENIQRKDIKKIRLAVKF